MTGKAPLKAGHNSQREDRVPQGRSPSRQMPTKMAPKFRRHREGRSGARTARVLLQINLATGEPAEFKTFGQPSSSLSDEVSSAVSGESEALSQAVRSAKAYGEAFARPPGVPLKL
jgi:hypothetical protein